MRKFLTFFLTALLAFGVGWAETTYQKVTSTEDITSGVYLIVCEKNFKAFDGSKEGSALNYQGHLSIRISSETHTITPSMQASSVDIDASTFTINVEEGTVKSKSGYYIGRTVNDKGMDISDEEKYTHTFAIDNNGNAIITSSGGAILRYNGANGSDLFRYYKSTTTNMTAIQLYKEVGGDEPPVTDPSLSVNTTSLTIGEGGGSFNVTGENLNDNVGVELTNGNVFTPTLSSSTNDFRNNEDGHWYFIPNDEEKLNGTVAVAYNGRDLTATSTVTMGTNKLDSDEDEVAQVTVTYQPDIYIVGDYLDGNLWGWANGIKMDYNNGEYSKTVTITNAGSCIMFARTTDATYDWNNGNNRLFFGASNSADWIYGESTDNHLATETSGQYYPIKFNQPGDYKITINAAEKTFTVTSNGVANLTEANAFAEGETFKFNGRVVVTHKQGKNLWIRDVANRNGSTTAGYIYAAANGADFEAGDVIKAGWTAKRSEYNGLTELTDAVGLEKDGTADFDPEVIEAINPETDINKYVKFEGVDKIVDNAGNTVELYNKFNFNFAFEEGKIYDVIGIVSYYNELQFYPISAEDVTPKELKVTLESETTTATVGETIPVTVNVENAEGSYTVTYKIGENGTETTLTGEVINVTSETAGEVTLFVTVTNNGKTATAQKTFTFTKPLAPLASKFVLVTNINQLEDGKQIIIADKNEVTTTSVLSTNQKSNNRAVVNQTVEDGLTITAQDETEIITLEKTGDYWYLRTRKTEGYLYAPGGGNYLRTEDAPTTNAKATISIENNGNATVEFNTNANQRYLRYNSGSDIYSCYASGQKDIYLYVEKPSTQEPVACELSYGEEAVVKTATVGDETFEEPTLINPHNVSPITYTSRYTDVATVNESGEVTIVGAGQTTITATFAGNDEYLAGEASYTIKVAKKTMGLAFEPTSTQAYVGQDVTEPALQNLPEGDEYTVAYSSSNAAVATVDASTGEVTAAAPGEAIITAKFAGNNVYEADSASYTITVKEKEVATLSFNVEGITVYPNAENFNQPVLTTTPAGLDVTYTSTDDDIATVVDGELVIGEKIGTATITAKFEGNDTYGKATASYTVTVEPRPIVVADDAVEFALYVGETESQAIDLTCENLKGDITLTLNDETGFFTIDPTTITKDDAENATVTVTYAPTTEGTHEATVTISTLDALENVTVTLTGIAVVRPVVATPTFSPVPGSYTSAQTVTIKCATQGATIKYSTDGGNSWNEGNTVNVDKDMTIQVMAEQDGMTASSATATYVIDIPEVKPTMEPIDGYFKVMNNGNQKFVNVAGRKTITFANEANIDKMAGTVVYLKTDEHGQVQSLRSQAADLQGYADRAMRYVPEIVQMAVDKLHAEGTGEILGNEGLDSIMAKFDECFDHHLYVEAAEGGYRLYGKTPSMQHVVDFYRENQEKVDAKLPQLEAFINSAIEKVLEKTGGRGASILQPFSLRETWQRMGGTLTEPVDEASTMAFYREVLNNKNYVWDFAYETAMTYWERLKNNQTFIENKDKLGEFAQYIDKIEDVRPDFKYYIVQDNNQIDYISEGNVDIINTLPRTVWTLTPRDKFTVNFDSNMTMDDRLYYTTLYTDFAYSMPEGVKAYKVTEVNNNGVGAIEALEGTIPAQTPVLLKSNAAGDVELTIAAAGNADVTGNLLVGADYFINTYEIKTPQVEGMFNMVATVFGENSSFYQELLNKYGYLMIKTSGTVNNKYFWALTNDDLMECVVENELGEEDCVVRTLGKDEDGIGFYSEWTAPINQAFLASDKFNPVKLLLGKDVTRDGLWNVVDVTATISIILGTAPENNNYDYDAADFDNSGRINVADVTAMIAYILGK